MRRGERRISHHNICSESVLNQDISYIPIFFLSCASCEYLRATTHGHTANETSFACTWKPSIRNDSLRWYIVGISFLLRMHRKFSFRWRLLKRWKATYFRPASGKVLNSHRSVKWKSRKVEGFKDKIPKSAGRTYHAHLLHNQTLKSILRSLQNINFWFHTYILERAMRTYITRIRCLKPIWSGRSAPMN